MSKNKRENRISLLFLLGVSNTLPLHNYTSQNTAFTRRCSTSPYFTFTKQAAPDQTTPLQNRVAHDSATLCNTVAKPHFT